MRTAGNYELIVKFRASESTPFNPNFNQGASHSYTTVDETGSRVRHIPDSTHTTSYPEDAPRPMTPKKVSYECVDYRVENGALFITESLSGNAGFIIPLDAILEIEVRNNRPVRKKDMEEIGVGV